MEGVGTDAQRTVGVLKGNIVGMWDKGIEEHEIRNLEEYCTFADEP